MKIIKKYGKQLFFSVLSVGIVCLAFGILGAVNTRGKVWAYIFFAGLMIISVDLVCGFIISDKFKETKFIAGATIFILAEVYGVGIIAISLQDVSGKKIDSSSWLGFLGTLIGASITVAGTYVVTQKQIKVVKQEKKDEIDAIKAKSEKQNREQVKIYCNIIYLDLSNAFYEGFKVTKSGKDPRQIPMYTEYQKAIIGIKEILTPDEINRLYRIYGMFEKIRYDILQHLNGTQPTVVIQSYRMMLEEVFDTNKYNYILGYDLKMITDAIVLENMKKAYRDIFKNIKDKIDEQE